MKFESLIPKLVKASLDNDRRLIEEISLMFLKSLKKSHPELSQEIAQALTFSRVGGSALRSSSIQPLPIDKESRFTLAKAEEPIEIEAPILAADTLANIEYFIEERNTLDKLIEEGIMPPSSMIFVGPPGVGKTYTARWLSYKLNLPLITMDLATSISSFLGRSGQNLKGLFDYARLTPSILFLDEIDAIAKKRDDMSDLGELKRLVNVLLKEMESWSYKSVLIAATNHPDLLDKAIWRRFDRTINFKLPEEEERQALISQNLGKFTSSLRKATFNYLILQSKKMSAADVCRMCLHIKRQIVMRGGSADLIAIEIATSGQYRDKKEKVFICNFVKDMFPDLSGRDIARVTKLPVTSVSRYLKGGNDQ